MRRIIALVGLLLAFAAVPAYCQNETAVKRAKDDLAASGAQVEHKACTDFEIAKVVAGRVAGAGLLTKSCCGDANDPNRSHCEFNGEWYAHDIVAFADGTLVDIAEDGGGKNGPRWDVAPPDPALIGRYRSAASLGLNGIVPGVSPVPTPVPVPPAPPVVDLKPLQDRIAALEQAVADLSAAVADLSALAGAANETAAKASSGTVDLRNYLKTHPIPDGCRVSYFGCKPTFNYPPVQ